ncbi:MAG TPA: S41 family peptidase, partial [Phycisphaerae bacterium]|nr:S41 family peptidase [Phycisphaerae bacterium]
MPRLHQLAAILLVVIGLHAAAFGESHLMRFADVSDNQIVFTYENDLWLAPITGGIAKRITNDPGVEMWARFSPDGKTIAFTGQYDGGMDVYIMDTEGGVPRRLTYHPAMDRVLGWWPDGKSIYFRSTREYPFRGEENYRVFIDTGDVERLPVDRAGLSAISPDGKSIVYNRISREAATWKRHVGGDAQDLWMGSFDKLDYHKITDWPGTDNYPMWQGDAIYFTSDRQFGTLNIYKYDVKTGNITPMTTYKDFDVKYPSIGPKHIIYQYAESLYLLDLTTGKSQMVPVEIPSDLTRVRTEYIGVSPTVGAFGLSPTGVRMLVEARGEILNMPVKDGEPINLTKTSGSREKNCAWSPDGRWIAFISDKTGEEEVYLVDQKGEKEWKQLTQDGKGLRKELVWSPDSKYVLFADKYLKLNLVDAETGELSLVDQGEYDDAWERWGIMDYVWSPDSKWIAYTKQQQTMYESIFLYSMDQKKSFRVTDDQQESWSPSFDPGGKYLYFLSNRTFNPTMCMVDQEHIFLDMARPYIVLLQADAASPFAPKDSAEEVKEAEKPKPEAAEGETPKKEESAKKDETKDKPAAEAKEEGQEKPAAKEEPKEEKKEAKSEKKESKDEKKKETKIDIDGIERRIVAAEGVSAGNYFRLTATDKGFLYLAKTEPEFEKYQNVGDRTGGKMDLYNYDIEEKKATKNLSGIANYHLSANGKKLVYRAGGTYGVLDVGKSGSVGDGKVDLGRVRILLDRTQEFMQEFNEAWRIQRDFFYEPAMHGLDWPAVREQYAKFVPFCGNRGDLNYLIGEMISELNIGHTYVSGGDTGGGGKSVSTGMLGAEFTLEPGAKFLKISHIIPGTPGDPGARSPLDEPGCPIKVGMYLIAIDGQPVPTAEHVFKALQTKSDAVVTLTYNDQPSAEGAKTYRTKTIGGENTLRYREWVEKNRKYVDEKSGGQIGYLHIPDMGASGLIEFAKAWYPQTHKKGFIIDERYNGGGFTADMVINRLAREMWAVTIPREGKLLRVPERVFHGSFVVLVNEDTGSDGEFFGEAIKILKLAPIIGMRTWGGAIGIEPHQDLVDGGSITPPQFGLYGLDRRWLIEGIGVVPDIQVQNMPGDVVRGKDAQLDAGMEHV